MHKYVGIWTIVLLVYFLKTCSINSAVLTPNQSTDIRGFVEHVRRCRGAASFTIAVASKDGAIFKDAFGLADKEEDRAATSESLFAIGSTTKAFTSMLIAMLVDEKVKNVTWQTKVRDILGSDFYLYTSILTEETTIRDLLSHSTGVPDNFIPLMAILPEGHSRKTLVENLRYHAPRHSFRSKFEYNNYMYVLAGYLAEKLTGSVWEDLIEEKILRPLGMHATTFVNRLADWSTLASSYAELDDQLHLVNKTLIRQTSIPGPAGSLLSNAHDMALWLQFLLKKGVTDSEQRLISEEVFNSIFDEQMAEASPMSDRDLHKPMFPVSDVTSAYDLAWITSHYRGYKKIWHSGGVTTYKSQVWFFPDMDFGIFIASTGPPKFEITLAIELINHYISDILLKEPAWINSTIGCTFPSPWKKPKERKPRPELPDDDLPHSIDIYLGTYKHPGFGNVLISRGDGLAENKLHLHMDQHLDLLFHYNSTEDMFHGQYLDYYFYVTERLAIRFSKSPGSKVMDVLHLPLSGPFDIDSATKFLRGKAYDRKDWTPPSIKKTSCQISAAMSPLTSSITILNLEVIVMLTQLLIML